MFLSLFAQIMPFLNPLIMFSGLLGMLKDVPKDQKRKVIVKEMLASLATMFLVLFTGLGILNLFGISLTSVRLAGGFLLFITGLKIMGVISSSGSSDTGPISFFVPITMPFVVGPGVITCLLTMVGEHDVLVVVPVLFAAWLTTTLTLIIGFTFFADISAAVMLAIANISGLILTFLSTEMMSRSVMEIMRSI